MIEISKSVALIAGAVLAVLVLGSAFALYTGLRARLAARAAFDENAHLLALLATAPARPLIIRGDGRLEMSTALADWLGLASPIDHFEALMSADGGIARASRVPFADAVAAGQRAGRAFRMPIRAEGSARRLLAVGDRAPSAMNAPGGVLVWFFDATELQGEVERLFDESARLAEAHDALSGLIEAAPMPMWYRAADLKLAMVNSAYVRAVDASDAANVIARQTELVEASGTSGPIASAADARDSGKPQILSLPATIAGARRMLRFHTVPLPNGGTAGFAVDIDELEQARAGLKRFVEAQRAMLDRLSAGVAQFGPDRSLVFCNQPFRSLFAMRPEWLTDRPEFDRVLERMREAKRLPEVRDFPNWKAERREWFTATDGAIEESWSLPGAIHLRVVAQPLPEGGLLLIFEDRTEQMQLAVARDTLLRVRTATFDNLFEALGVFSADGRLQLWNEKFRKVWAFEEGFLDAHPRVDALAGAAAPRLAKPARASLIPELVKSATIERVQRGGRLAMADGRHFEFGAVPLPDGNALLTMLDISDSRRIEQALRDRNDALEASDRVKTAFVANMSYELRTPLTSIKGFAEMLEGGYGGALEESAAGYVAAILESVARLGTLIDDVLDLTASDNMSRDQGVVDIGATARAAADALQSLAGERRIDLVVEIAESAGNVVGEERRIREAIEHMLRHAITDIPEAGPEKAARRGRVLLHVDGDDLSARIVVSDDGPGMSDAAIAHAFDRFVAGDRGRADARPLALGLPLARQFVEAHGGTVRLVSELGTGTMLIAEVPRG